MSKLKTILVLTAGLNLMAQTKLSIAPSPDNRVSVSSLGENKRFERVFNAETNQFRDLHVVVENQSDRAIVAAVMVWRYTAPSGKVRRTTLETDVWLRPHAPGEKMEIVPANSKALFGPSGGIPETMVGVPGIGNGILPDQFARFAGFTNPEFSIDLLVFSDGEMVGADTMHTSTEFAARYSAAQKVIAAWKLGGKPAVSTLSEIQPEPPFTREEMQEINWIRKYSKQIANGQGDPAANIDYLANSSKPIALFRKNGGIQ